MATQDGCKKRSKNEQPLDGVSKLIKVPAHFNLILIMILRVRSFLMDYGS
jgi:hypothetical protein